MNSRKAKHKTTMRIALFSLTLILLLSLAANATSNKPNESSAEIPLGASTGALGFDLAIREQGSLKAGDLVLILSVPDQLGRIQMIAPQGAKTNRSLR